MNLLYLTGCRLYGPKLLEVNNTYRAAIAGRSSGATLGGPGFGCSLDVPIYLPDYVEGWDQSFDAIFIADPWHNFWDPCDTYPDCPPLYTGIDELRVPVVIESGDSQFYYQETLDHLSHAPSNRAVCIRAMSHFWRFTGGDPNPLNPEENSKADRDHQTFYLPHGAYDEMVEASLGVPKTIDVLFSGSDHPQEYPARARIADALRSAPDIKTHWLPHPSNTKHRVIGPEFWRLVASAKIAVAGTNVFQNLTMRYLEIPACGTMPIGDLPVPEKDADDWPIHIMDIDTMQKDEIASHIRSFLAAPSALAIRTNAAREFVLTRHKFEHEWARVMKEIESWIS